MNDSADAIGGLLAPSSWSAWPYYIVAAGVLVVLIEVAVSRSTSNARSWAWTTVAVVVCSGGVLAAAAGTRAVAVRVVRDQAHGSPVGAALRGALDIDGLPPSSAAVYIPSVFLLLVALTVFLYVAAVMVWVLAAGLPIVVCADKATRDRWLPRLQSVSAIALLWPVVMGVGVGVLVWSHHADQTPTVRAVWAEAVLVFEAYAFFILPRMTRKTWATATRSEARS
ncbi:hypothetical protein [Luteipulveratus halotolerans]|uniref:Uncharacterized protein n=1 Tax=Luteipulveratus halotolerans TaxID=1631356 RepID=A0A0L6CPX9_9MICO|nr:hypothetical protein [Luteipulveratus halotolerans]KNX39667.1 hypothetical protein VV01_00055 [Luteipulveratus halotolerans]KNX39710.1 hypothetical protein VV01_00310 [Luteipulveratus halotolerans]